MFKIEFEYTEKLNGFLDMLDDLTDHISLHVTSEGVEITELDQPHITWIHLKIPKKFFNYFKFTKLDKEETVRVYIEDLKRVLSLAKKDDIIEISKQEDNDKTIEIVLERDDRETYTIPLSDFKRILRPSPPELDFDEYNSCEIPWYLLKEQVNNLYSFSTDTEEGEFLIDEDKFIIQLYPTTEDYNGKTEYLHGESSLIGRKEVKCCYSLLKLQQILQAKIDDVIIIFVNTEMPLKISSEHNDIKLEFLLAPRIHGVE